MPQNKVVLNWSSGKDAALALHLLGDFTGYEVTQLLTTLNAEAGRVFMHGTREAILDAQAARIGLPLTKLKLPPSPDDSVYKEAMREALAQLSADGVSHAAFGDIFLEDLKAYREAQLDEAGLKGAFPLWKMDTRALIGLVEASGIEAVIVCVNASAMGKEFLGRKINRDLLNDLPDGVDPCGERGEYHTCVVNAPFFSSPIAYSFGETVFRQYAAAAGGEWDQGFYFLDVVPEV